MNEIREPDRDEEVARALLAPLERVQPVALQTAKSRVRRSKRSYLTRRLVPVLVLAAVAFAFLLIAPWQHGPGPTVMERALAAIGDRPVLHVVLRRHVDPRETWGYVDLASGKETPMGDRREIWYDSERHFEHDKWGIEGASGSAQEGLFAEHEILQTPTGYWASYDIVGGTPRSPSLNPALGEFFDGYRSALANHTAQVAGTGVVNGHDVTWIDLKPGHSHSQYMCKESERVAVDRTTSLPIQIGCFYEGKYWPGFDVISIETLPAGSGDFSKPEKTKDSQTGYSSECDQITPITASAAVEALPGAFWAGESVFGLQLSSVSRATLTSKTYLAERLSTTATETGIELHYGVGWTAALWSEPFLFANEKPSGTGVVIHEEKANPNFFFWPWPAAPAGSMLTNNGGEGYLVKDGIYVEIRASSQKLLLAVAKTLRPIDAGSSHATP
jgi:hypothetical protein